MSRKWVYKPGHPKANERGFVAAEDYYTQDVEFRALDAPILAGRFYENTQATDGTDIGSRQKHRDYMKAKGVTSASDYSDSWYESQRKQKEWSERRGRLDELGRAAYQVLEKGYKPNRRDD